MQLLKSISNIIKPILIYFHLCCGAAQNWREKLLNFKLALRGSFPFFCVNNLFGYFFGFVQNGCSLAHCEPLFDLIFILVEDSTADLNIRRVYLK